MGLNRGEMRNPQRKNSLLRIFFILLHGKALPIIFLSEIAYHSVR